MLGFMDLRWPRVARRSNVGLVYICVFVRARMRVCVHLTRLCYIYGLVLDSHNNNTGKAQITVWLGPLSHFPLGKMSAISQTIFSNSFSCKKSFIL